jgi:hypothetical protein
MNVVGYTLPEMAQAGHEINRASEAGASNIEQLEARGIDVDAAITAFGPMLADDLKDVHKAIPALDVDGLAEIGSALAANTLRGLLVGIVLAERKHLQGITHNDDGGNDDEPVGT